MVSVKVKFRPSSVVDMEGSIYYQIIHERKVRQLLTDYKIFPAEWNEKRSAIAIGSVPERKQVLLSINGQIRRDVERLMRIVMRFEDRRMPISGDVLIDEFERYMAEYSLFNYMESQIADLKHRHKTGTAYTYRATLNSFRSFRKGYDIMLDAMDSKLMLSYESFLQDKGVTPNTSSFYMRNLRAVYNKAVDAGIIEDCKPFRHVYTGVDKTVKRALPLAVIRRIRSLDLSASPKEDYARDMFLMSFYLRGMSLVDMSYLRKSDLREGHVSYRRRKTGQKLEIEWRKEMQCILDKYPENDTEFLLPIITGRAVNKRSSYKNAGYRINRHLKAIALKVKAPIGLTLYCARHSWASAAKNMGVPVSVISEAMGHDSEATTQIYLASLETSVVDKVNSIIIAAIK